MSRPASDEPCGCSARWRALMTQVDEKVVLLDESGQMTHVSGSVERRLGYRCEELVGRALAAMAHPEDLRGLQSAVDACTSDGPQRFSLRVRARDGRWRVFASSAAAVNDGGRAHGVLIVGQEVTDRTEPAHDRTQLQAPVAQRLAAVGQLSAGIAHEINTPLQFVGDSLSFAEGAVEELLSLVGIYRDLLWTDAPIPMHQRRSEVRRAEDAADVDYLCERIPPAFSRMSEGIERVRSIVQAMKRFSHAGATERVSADLNEAIETTLAVSRNEYKYVADVELALGELPAVLCNIGELNQVFLNLIINAAQAIETKFAGTDRLGRIRISTRVDGDEVVAEIADDGPGIPPALIDRIYEPFFTTKDVGRGTGQGLALARATLERHRGSIDCVSVPGEGTAFTIRLPLTSAEAMSPVFAS